MKIGIDKISFYVPNYYLDLKTLGESRNVDYMKYKKGLLLNKMSLAPKEEDIISMAANATLNFLTKEDIEKIDIVIFTTESGLDYSKAASTNLISILGLKNNVRAVEMKQACYSSAAALYFAKGHILQNPDSKVLILASDIARYGLNSSGEPTQGAGSTAMIVSRDPKVLTIENHHGVYADDVYDFYRPDGLDYALVDGHYSNETYKKFFINTYNDYLNKAGESLTDLDALVFHIPYAKLGLKALELVANQNDNRQLFKNFNKSIVYNREVGNIYTGSLFLSLISLLEQGSMNDGEKIGMFAYGSGAVAEFFSGTLVNGYKNYLHKELHENLLDKRIELDINEYEEVFYNSKAINNTTLESLNNGKVQLKEINNYQRKYIINK